MRRWVLQADRTDLDGLVLEDQAPVPEPGPGQVRVRVRAVSLNARDLMILGGVYGRIAGRDLVPVSDGAGEIDAVGDGVDGWHIGDRVMTLYLNWLDGPPSPNAGGGLGSYNESGVLAEYVVLPAHRVVPAPAGLDHTAAATLPCAALTAWNALTGHNALSGQNTPSPGSDVLVLGSGGVALFALAFARAFGARVTATSSDDSTLQRLLEAGASHAVNYRTTPDWGSRVAELTGGADIVVNAAGPGELTQCIAAAAPGGEIATMGLMSWPDPQAPLDVPGLMGKGLTIRGVGVGSATMSAAMSRFIEDHHLTPQIAQVYGLPDAPAAYRTQQSHGTFGKIVIELR